MRCIGIRHQTKMTMGGEARPTQVAILREGKEAVVYDLRDETAEKDWVQGKFPVKFREAEPNENLKLFPAHQVKWKKIKDARDFPENLLKKEGKATYLAAKVPCEFDGFKPNDIIGMVLGGSGDYLAFALSRLGENQGARVLRIPSFLLQEKRTRDKNEDALTLAELVRDCPQLFYPTIAYDRQMINLRNALKNWERIVKDRIKCEQRIYASLPGQVFCREDGLPEEPFDKIFEKAKLEDSTLREINKEEKEKEKILIQQVKEISIYEKIFKPITGCGPLISARIIASVIDIRRFATVAKLKAYCGVHVLPNGTFPRRRRAGQNNWPRNPRQALYLLGEQFNRRPNSEWGLKLKEYKKHFREIHPEAVQINGKKRYTDGHIHRMAIWRTLTKFIEKIYKEWKKI